MNIYIFHNMYTEQPYHNKIVISNPFKVIILRQDKNMHIIILLLILFKAVNMRRLTIRYDRIYYLRALKS